MAIGALEKSAPYADFAISITGLAGPLGDADFPEVKVGTVFIASASKDESNTVVKEYHFFGSRNEIRTQAAKTALEMAAGRTKPI
jgi:nicotinamide mononucleotide (NMN) deamidase PncC